jgi:predicted regulator of Ras-like GTPase activity (Roadblock/LC7/MglB family)
MSLSNFLLNESEHSRIKSILAKIQEELQADLVLLIDRSGQQIAAEGSLVDFDLTAIASLAAANLAATEGLAHLVGESQFAALHHQGNYRSIHITSVARQLTLVLVFRETVVSGKVRWKVKKSAASLDHAVENIQKDMETQRAELAGAPSVPFFTDEEIDKLFGRLDAKPNQERKE